MKAICRPKSQHNFSEKEVPEESTFHCMMLLAPAMLQSHSSSLKTRISA